MAAAAVLVALVAAASAAPVHLGPPPPREVTRIVTLAPSLSELVLALGAGDRLVGVTRFDDDPRTAGLTRVGGYNDPEPETVLKLRPHLVLAQPGPTNRGPVEALARLGVPIDVLPLGNVADVERAIELVAERLGVPERGARMVERIEQHRAAVRARMKDKPRVRALLVFGLDPLIVAGPASFAGELLADAGAAELLTDRSRPYLRLSAEHAVSLRPELIVLSGMEVAPPRGRPAIAGLERVPVRPLRSTAVMHPGPRLAEALDDLVEALHGSRPK